MPSKFDPRKHHRRSIRLPNHDYAQSGTYSVTIVTYQRASLFGQIMKEEMQLNDLGKIADECWRDIPEHFPHVELGADDIMPNHVHGIIVIRSDADAPERRGTIPSTCGLGRCIVPLQNNFKNPLPVRFLPSSAHIRLRFRVASGENSTLRRSGNAIIYEQVIRHERDLQNRTDYIEANPMQWDQDHENPANLRF